jgi:Zn-dependent peptidase ImmA (M78 family)
MIPENIKRSITMGRKFRDNLGVLNIKRHKLLSELKKSMCDIGIITYNNTLPVGTTAIVTKTGSDTFDINMNSSKFPLFYYAHTLGHLFIHCNDTTKIYDDSNNIFVDTPIRDSFYREEEEADAFAYGLLLPDKWDDKISSNEELAEEYKVPNRILKTYRGVK